MNSLQLLAAIRNSYSINHTQMFLPTAGLQYLAKRTETFIDTSAEYDRAAMVERNMPLIASAFMLTKHLVTQWDEEKLWYSALVPCETLEEARELSALYGFSFGYTPTNEIQFLSYPEAKAQILASPGKWPNLELYCQRWHNGRTSGGLA